MAEKKAAFLAELRKKGTMYHAAHVAGIGRSTAYVWREKDPEFAAAWDEATQDNLDELEKSLFERAVHGVEEPIFYQGAQCGSVRRYSDTAAIFLLKGNRPKYRERFEHSVDQATINSLADLVKRAASDG